MRLRPWLSSEFDGRPAGQKPVPWIERRRAAPSVLGAYGRGHIGMCLGIKRMGRGPKLRLVIDRDQRRWTDVGNTASSLIFGFEQEKFDRYEQPGLKIVAKHL